MVQYILECIAFQLVFLIIYDLFLKRETFFQWNRLYLIGTYIISMVLPWIKIEAMKTTVPESFQTYPEFLWQMNDTVVVVNSVHETAFSISWEYVFLFGGMLIATLFFGYKLFQIYALKKKGEVHYFKDFTRIIVANSSIAFSFFKSIFLGDKVIEKEHENILQHELVHIRQRHSYDLIFFELMRIVGWFNPLVYVYQSRVSELHEFIADANVAKTNKKEQYQQLLSEVFQTQHISFINQFFKSSLIKKRIVMLTKEKSKEVFKLKYLLLVPLLVGMLFYTSCAEDNYKITDTKMVVKNIEEMSFEEDQILFNVLNDLSISGKHWEFLLTDEVSAIRYIKSYNGSFIKFSNEKTIDATMVIESNPLSHKINSLMEEIKAKDSLNNPEIGALASMIYETYPEGIKGISGEKGNIVFEKNKNYSKGITDSVSMGAGKGYLEQYDLLLQERKRLLEEMNERNPVIIELDKQLKILKEAMTQETETVPFAVVDKAPVFPGCEDEDGSRECFKKMMQKHISKNFQYPQEAQEKRIQGRVSIMFTIGQDGNVQNVRMRGPDKILEKEAARIISLLPKMTPGRQKGENVNVPFSIPISFKLDRDNFFDDRIQLSRDHGANRVYIIDGVESTKAEFEAIGEENFKELNFLNEEASIQKYGQAGKNGVVEVKTKGKN